MTVLTTTDYKIFSFHPSNRPIEQDNLERIMKSLSGKNLIKLQPILVNSEMQVIDGQHRLEACKRLDLPVSYIIEDELTLDDIVRLNANKSEWQLDNYVHFHAANGNPHYIKLEEFSKKHRFPLKIALLVIGYKNKGTIVATIREGKLKFPEPKEFEQLWEIYSDALEIIALIYQLSTLESKKFITTPAFLKAVLCFINIPGILPKVLKSKIGYKCDMIRHCASHADYLKIFQYIYDYRSKNRVAKDLVFPSGLNIEDMKKIDRS